MLYQISDGTLSFGDKVVLSHVNMEIKGSEKIGVVGPNGTGKTTLLKLLSGELSLDRDDKRKGKGVTASRSIKVGTLSQNHTQWLLCTVEAILLEGLFDQENVSEVYSQERFYYEQRYDRLLQNFGFSVEDKKKQLHEFSGGEQTKIMLVKLLMSDVDLLLLDEPTNHLDSESVEALEDYLKSYTKAAVIVSHDRYFLDQVAEVIYELEDAKLTRYAGNYSAYRIEKRKLRERQLKAYERQQEEITRNEQLIRQFKNKPRKAAFARSRKTLLDRMERIEKPKQDVGHIFTGCLAPIYPGPKWMLEMKELKIGYEAHKPLLSEIELRIKRGQKIGIIGKNGMGKTTLLKTLTHQLPPLKGRYHFGEKVDIGYFDQASGELESEEKVVDHFKKLFPGMLEKEVYNKLASYLFRGEICQHQVKTLSGGEKARLKLCELMTQCPNFMIMDEPTNHMDIPAKETMESAFKAYTGTVLIVSHDRYFLDQVVDALLVLEDGAAYYYPFGYTHYVESRKKMQELISKGVSIDQIPAVLTTKEQSMVAALKAVPKPKAIASRQLSDDEAYLEWKLSLAKEPMDAAEEQVAALSEAYEIQLEADLEKQLEAYEAEFSKDLTKPSEALTQMGSRLQDAEALWTKRCLEWYEIYND